jgi:hypothetical protein
VAAPDLGVERQQAVVEERRHVAVEVVTSTPAARALQLRLDSARTARGAVPTGATARGSTLGVEQPEADRASSGPQR